MVSQDVFQGGGPVVLSQGLVGPAAGRPSPGLIPPAAGPPSPGSPRTRPPPRKTPSRPPPLRRIGPTPPVRPLARLPGTAHPKAVAGHPGSIVQLPGQRNGELKGPACRRGHIGCHRTVTFSPGRIRFGSRIWGFRASSSVIPTPYRARGCPQCVPLLHRVAQHSAVPPDAASPVRVTSCTAPLYRPLASQKAKSNAHSPVWAPAPAAAPQNRHWPSARGGGSAAPALGHKRCWPAGQNWE